MTITNTERIVPMDEQTPDTTFETLETQEPSLATMLMKTAAINAAATAGSLMGLIGFGMALGKFQEYRANKRTPESLPKTDTTEA